MTNLKTEFGKKIKRIRKEKGITQEELAFRAGISVDFLSLIERGKNAPSFENLEKLADAFGAPVRDLFDFPKS